MRPLHAVLLTLANSSYRSPLLSRQQLAPLTPLAATLMHFPASVANKRLTAWLSPLAATLTKNRGGVMVNQHPPDLDVWTFRRSDVAAFQLHSLSVQRVFHNSFAFTRIHTLSENCRGVPLQFPFWNPTPRLSKRMRTRPLAFSSSMYSICLAPDGMVQLRAARSLQSRHGQLRQRSKSPGHAADRLPVPLRLQHQPQDHRPQLSLARAIQRFPWHGHVAADAYPPCLAGCASAVPLQSWQLAGSLRGPCHAPWFADGFSGAHRGAAGRLWKLLPSATNWRARNGFPDVEPSRVLGHGGLVPRHDRRVLNLAPIGNHALDRQRRHLLCRIAPQRAQFQCHDHRLACPGNDSPPAALDRVGLVLSSALSGLASSRTLFPLFGGASSGFSRRPKFTSPCSRVSASSRISSPRFRASRFGKNASWFWRCAAWASSVFASGASTCFPAA